MAPAISSSSDEECECDQWAILDQLLETEQAHSLALGGLGFGMATQGGRMTRRAFQDRFQSEVLSRLSLISANSRAQTSAIAGTLPFAPASATVPLGGLSSAAAAASAMGSTSSATAVLSGVSSSSGGGCCDFLEGSF